MTDGDQSLVERLRERAGQTAQGMTLIESDRAVAEIRAAMVIARTSPRDHVKCLDLILVDCQRKELAEAALYSYARGGMEIAGPSIRLAEAIARRWGNMECGVKELSRHDGYSECAAYAWDLETNFRDWKAFQVRHWRDTKAGGYALKDERDIYETLANQGARRKRACILAIIPGDVVEAAVAQCERTLKTAADTPETIQKLITAFVPFGITREHIEKRIQRRLDTIQPAQVVSLKKIYMSLRDGMSGVRDWFEMDAVTGNGSPAPAKGSVPSPQPPDQPVIHGTGWPHLGGDGLWRDSTGVTFREDQHGWNSEEKRPSVTAQGVFRARRGTGQAEASGPPQTTPPRAISPPGPPAPSSGPATPAAHERASSAQQERGMREEEGW